MGLAKKTVLLAAAFALGSYTLYASPMSETELDGVDFARNGVGRITVYSDKDLGKIEPVESGDYSPASPDKMDIPEGVPSSETLTEKTSSEQDSSKQDAAEKNDNVDNEKVDNEKATDDKAQKDLSSESTDASSTANSTESSSETEKPAETEKQTETQPEKNPAPNKKKLTLDGVDNPLTQKYITQYQTKTNLGWLVMCLNNSVPYRPYIQKKLAENNMPMELQYLPIIESNFKNTAVSSSGATGMWQFMTNSMAPLLSKNEWYDERRDPWKATDAAVRKLLDNYAMFKDWPLAIAAYNCGAGAMSRILKANPGLSYWELSEKDLLRTETALYVAKLVAVAELIENAEYYGLIEVGIADKQIEGASVEEYDFATVTYKATVGYISELTGIEKDTLNFLNPALLKDCTPDSQEYKLRVPLGKGEEVTKIMKENAPPVTFVYTVEKGDSLWGISRRYGVTLDTLCDMNEIDEKAILSIGQKLVVPIVD